MMHSFETYRLLFKGGVVVSLSSCEKGHSEDLRDLPPRERRQNEKTWGGREALQDDVCRVTHVGLTPWERRDSG